MSELKVLKVSISQLLVDYQEELDELKEQKKGLETDLDRHLIHDRLLCIGACAAEIHTANAKIRAFELLCNRLELLLVDKGATK